jgi:hypothetical protein
MHRETEIEFSIFADNICCSYIFAYIKFTLLNILRKDMIWRTIHTSQLRQCISPFRFETKSVEVRMYNTLFLSILLYGCEYGSVCLWEKMRPGDVEHQVLKGLLDWRIVLK